MPVRKTLVKAEEFEARSPEFKKDLHEPSTIVNIEEDIYDDLNDGPSSINDDDDFEVSSFVDLSTDNLHIDRMNLKIQVSQYEQTQQTRIALGNRLFAAFIQSIGIEPGTRVYANPKFRQLMNYIKIDKGVLTEEEVKILEEKENKTSKEKTKEQIAKENAKAAELVIEYLQKDYGLITKAVASILMDKDEVTLYEKRGIIHTVVAETSVGKLERALYTIFKDNRESHKYMFIQTVGIYTMVQTFVKLYNTEKQIYENIKRVVHKFPLWYNYAVYIKGFGELTIARFLAKVNIHKCDKITKLWAYVGYDTVVNPETGLREGRTNGFFKGKKHHLVKRIRKLSDGSLHEYESISYSPYMKTSCYKAFGSFIKAKNEMYTTLYREYRARLEAENQHKDDKLTLGHINMMAVRYVMKYALQDLWVHWRLMEGYKPTTPYADMHLNHTSHIRTFNMDMSDFKKNVTIELIDWKDLYDKKYFTGRLYDDLDDSAKNAA